MNESKAIETLRFHSARCAEINDVRCQQGFLGSLRPYQGMELVESNFHSIISCIAPLAPYLKNTDTIDKNIVTDIAGILCFGRAWAGHEGSSLLRNNLITTDEARTIAAWLDCISYAWAILLDTQDEKLAFESYNEQYKI